MHSSPLHTVVLHRSVRGALAVVLAAVAAGVRVPAAAQAQAPPDEKAFLGTWMSTTGSGGPDHPLRIERSEDGTLIAYGWGHESFGGDRHLNVARVTIREDSLFVDARRTGVDFAGELSEDGSRIEGVVTLGRGPSFPVTFAPADASVTVPPPLPQPPEADPADVKSIEAIVQARREAVSAPEGEEPDWDRLRSLFLPGARLLRAFRLPGAAPQYRTGTVEEWIETSGKRAHAHGGVRQEAVHTVTERYDDIAHVLTTYEAGDPADATGPTSRGVETMQLWYDGDRWWIVSVMWQAERERAPIPERYGGRT